MPSSSSNTESQSYQSDDSEWNYIPGAYNIKKTSASGENGSEMRDSNSHHEGNVGPYANDPVADEDWLANYRERKQTYNERLKKLQLRLDGTEEYFFSKYCCVTDQTLIRDMLFYKSIVYITGVNAKIATSNCFTIVKRASAVWKLRSVLKR